MSVADRSVRAPQPQAFSFAAPRRLCLPGRRVAVLSDCRCGSCSMTSFKTMAEIRARHILAWPSNFTLDAWRKRLVDPPVPGSTCDGVQVGFWNSVRILVPSVIAVDLSSARSLATR